MSKFLTYEDRMLIERYLNENYTFTEIGSRIGKNRTTVAKEVRQYSIELCTGYSVYPHNVCKLRKVCRQKRICGNSCRHLSGLLCKQCEEICNKYCDDFEEEICMHRSTAPYACNGCRELKKCTLTKTMYEALEAQRSAAEKLSQSRSGIFSTEGEVARLNALLVPLVKQGHSLHQIYVNHKDELMCSEKTLYNYVDGGLFDIRNIDLPRKVKYRPRYKKPELKVDRACRVGRNYHDYELYIQGHPDTAVAEMDSVIGSRGGKVLLTIYFTAASLMLAYIRDANTAKSVIDIFDGLFNTLGGQDFRRLFPVILTDNGSEFSNPKSIEKGPDQASGFVRTRIYYCNAGAPYQKAEIEVGHEFIRRIVPKGETFDDLTQEDVTKMMDHINSYRRKKLNNRSPYEAFRFYYGEELLQKLGCHEVPTNSIILKPALLRK
jgi:IS30 family transposase